MRIDDHSTSEGQWRRYSVGRRETDAALSIASNASIFAAMLSERFLKSSWLAPGRGVALGGEPMVTRRAQRIHLKQISATGPFPVCRLKYEMSSPW